MKAEINITKEQQVVTTEVEVKKVTLELSLEEASLLRTSAYAIYRQCVDQKLKELYYDIFNTMVASKVSAFYAKSADDFRSALGYPPRT